MKSFPYLLLLLSDYTKTRTVVLRRPHRKKDETSIPERMCIFTLVCVCRAVIKAQVSCFRIVSFEKAHVCIHCIHDMMPFKIPAMMMMMMKLKQSKLLKGKNGKDRLKV